MIDQSLCLIKSSLVLVEVIVRWNKVSFSCRTEL